MIQIQSQTYCLIGYAESKQGGRPENQDDLGWIDTPLGFLVVVCDGMGGGPGGKTASYIAKTVFLSEMLKSSPQASPAEALKRAVSMANDALYQKMDEVPSLRGMGSTLVAVLINKKNATIVHLGDSRCYQIRDKRIVFRTTDHSLVAGLVQNKALTEEQARVSPQSNVIMRGLGNTNNHAPEIEEVPYKYGDRFILCTDGVWGIMPHEELSQRFTSQQDLSSFVDNLSQEIDRRGYAIGGHHDNHTMAVIEMKKNSMIYEMVEKKTKIIITILGALLFFSILFNIFSSKASGNTEEIEALKTELADKEKKISQLESYQKFYNEMKDAGSKDLITRMEVLEYEKSSLEKYVDELMVKIDSLEKKIASLSKNVTSTVKTSSTSRETAQRAINRLNSMRDFIGKDYAQTLGKKRTYRDDIVKSLMLLDNQTSQKYQSTINAIIDELKHEKSEALLITLTKDKTYVSTKTATKKIEQLIQKIKNIKDKL